MTNLYDITDKNGRHLCYQVARTEQEAIDFARMYGHRKAAVAEFVRRD